MLTSETVNTFLAVARAGSFLQAADIVGVSQSTVSQRIRMLEQLIGRTLILRTRGSRGLTLTPAGNTFLELAERWTLIELEVDRLKMSSERRLALGSVDSLSIYVLPQLFGRLFTTSPPIHLHLETGRYWQLHDRVASGHLQAAFTLTPPDHIDLIVEEIASYDMHVVAHCGMLPEAGARIDIRDLPPERELFMEWSQELNRWRAGRPNTGSAGFVDKAHLLPPLLERGDVWALIPSFMIRAVEQHGEVRTGVLADPPPRLRMFFVRKRKDATFRSSELTSVRNALRELGLSAGEQKTG